MTNNINLEDIPDHKATVMNQLRRVAAHARLDKMLDDVDDVRDAFGFVRLDVLFQNGYFIRIEHTIKGVEQ